MIAINTFVRLGFDFKKTSKIIFDFNVAPVMEKIKEILQSPSLCVLIIVMKICDFRWVEKPRNT